MIDQKKSIIKEELTEHIPFTALATLVAVVIVMFTPMCKINLSETLFEVMHPLHVLFSAFATAAIYHKYKKNFLATLVIGIVGSILIGSFSDILIPWLGASLLSFDIHFHLPIIKEPLIILGAALLGTLLGIYTTKTKMPHLLHVFLSVFASLFYITAFTTNINGLQILISFFIVFLAVIIPCCLSDIWFPLYFVNRKNKKKKNSKTKKK